MLFEIGEHLVGVLLLIAESHRISRVDEGDLALIQFQGLFDSLVRIETPIDHPACGRCGEQGARLRVRLLSTRRLVCRAEKGGFRKLNLAELGNQTAPDCW